MSDFFAELRRRHIYRIGAVYVVVAWGIIQVLDVLSQLFALPDWIAQPAVVVLAIGFPVTLIAAWMIVGAADSGDPAGSLKATSTDWVLASALIVVIGLIGYQQVSSSIEPTSVAAFDDEAIEPLGEAGYSLAILPFGNLSPDPENAFFADGIHGELLTQLAKIGSLRVISQQSVMEYRDSAKNMREIGQELGVTHILEGDVQRAGDTVRINVQLVNTETDEQLWGEIYDRELTAQNLLAIQSQMAVAIASTLRANLSPDEVARLNDVPTENTRAYDFYLEGLGYLNSADWFTNVPHAVDAFSQAVAVDPEFAVAWAALSRAHSRAFWTNIDRTYSRLSSALGGAQLAFALAPGLPEAHFAMGEYHYRGSLNYEQALAELDAAENGLPSNAELLETRSHVLRRLGEWGAAITTMEQAIGLSPRFQNAIVNQGASYLSLRDYGRAAQYFDRALEIAPYPSVAATRTLISLYQNGDEAELIASAENLPEEQNARAFVEWIGTIYANDFGAALAVLDNAPLDTFSSLGYDAGFALRSSLYGVTYRLDGQLSEAANWFQIARSELEELLASSVDVPRVQLALGEALAGLGEREEAIAAAQTAIAMRSPSVDAYWGPEYQLQAAIRVLIPAGDFDGAMQELESYFGGPIGFWSIEGVLPDPRLDPIRDDPRFIALVEKYRRQ